jgi:hypothetical protein
MRYGPLAALLAAVFILQAVNASPAWPYRIYGAIVPLGPA